MVGSIFSALSLLVAPKSGSANPSMAEQTVDQLRFTSVSGEPIGLSDFTGQTVLVVNTASKCGFRSQFAELEDIYQTYRDKGFIVIGVPSNDFGNQEPDDNGSICQTYRSQLNLTFPITRKVHTRGPDTHPFFSQIKAIAGAHAAPKWNFYKYLIGRDGRLVAWFATSVKPASDLLLNTVQSELL